MKNKKKRGHKRIIIPMLFWIIMLLGCAYTFLCMQPISKESKEIKVNIKEGTSTKNIIDLLEEKELIRNKYIMYVYVKLNNITGLNFGEYYLNQNMKPSELFKTLQKPSNAKNEITITFPEGKTIKKYASVIKENTKYSEEDFLNLMTNKEYIQKLITKYTFLTDAILNENIYYPLEGYLASDTYNFKKDATLEEITETLLNQTDKVIKDHENKMTNTNLSIHEILTLASIVETEGNTLDDRKKIAGVFINRLKNNMALGSDVTTYYASQVEIGERDLYIKEINSDNPYNTRSQKNAGKLPVGPICNPSKNSIIASLEYTESDYLYFVADKNGKVYFTKNSDEHNNIINKLKKDGLWFNY